MRYLIALLAFAVCANAGLILPKPVLVEPIPIVKPVMVNPIIKPLVVAPVVKPMLPFVKPLPIVKPLAIVKPLPIVKPMPLLPTKIIVPAKMILPRIERVLPPLPAATECNKDGYAADLLDPSQFYRCVLDGKLLSMIPFKCPKGLVFNLKLSICL